MSNLLSDDWRLAKEIAIASLAGALGVYVRARHNPAPLTWDRCVVVAAESILCGFLAFGVASVLEFQDRAVSYAIAGSLGLIGTAFISDLAVKLLQRKADATVPPPTGTPPPNGR
jgi:hypothetical protein